MAQSERVVSAKHLPGIITFNHHNRGNGRDTHGSVKLWGQELKPTTRVRVGEGQIRLQKEGGACGPELSGRGSGGQEGGGHGGQCLKQWCARADIHGLQEPIVKCQ